MLFRLSFASNKNTSSPLSKKAWCPYGLGCLWLDLVSYFPYIIVIRHDLFTKILSILNLKVTLSIIILEEFINLEVIFEGAICILFKIPLLPNLFIIILIQYIIQHPSVSSKFTYMSWLIWSVVVGLIEVRIRKKVLLL